MSVLQQSKHCQILFNHNHCLYPIQISMNVNMRTVAVITNVQTPQGASLVNAKQDSYQHRSTENSALVSNGEGGIVKDASA